MWFSVWIQRVIRDQSWIKGNSKKFVIILNTRWPIMMSCDWFRPYKQSKYCVGVHYLTILNLPQSIRFRPENALFAGIIPGLKEPSQHEMNSHLRPLVKELNMSWIDGFEMKKCHQNLNFCGVIGYSV